MEIISNIYSTQSIFKTADYLSMLMYDCVGMCVCVRGYMCVCVGGYVCVCVGMWEMVRLIEI